MSVGLRETLVQMPALLLIYVTELISYIYMHIKLSLNSILNIQFTILQVSNLGQFFWSPFIPLGARSYPQVSSVFLLPGLGKLSVNLFASVLLVVSHPPVGQPELVLMGKARFKKEGGSVQDHISGYRCYIVTSTCILFLKQGPSPAQIQRLERKQTALKDWQSHTAKRVGTGRSLIRAIKLQSIYHSDFGQVSLFF